MGIILLTYTVHGTIDLV